MKTARNTRSAALAALALSATLHAADKPPAPQSAQQPSARQPGAGFAALQRPDLVVTIDDGGPGFPKTFTVKNVGSADSKLSVLKVSAVFVPPEGSLSGGGSGGASCDPPMPPPQCEALSSFLSAITGIGAPDPKVACGEPFKEIIEAVPVLKPGESKTFTRDTGPASILLKGFARTAGSPQGTHLKKCTPTLVCAFDVVAKADASSDNEELRENNNTTTKRAFRDVKYQ